jgi:hypothetical protein
MERKTQSGYLVLADISGYTSFVAQTEIEHADMALSFLLETIVEKISGVLTVSQLLYRGGQIRGRQIAAGADRSDLPGLSREGIDAIRRSNMSMQGVQSPAYT